MGYENVDNDRKYEAGTYFDSLQNRNDIYSGDMTLLPKDLSDKWDNLHSLEEAYYTEQKYYHPDERKEYAEGVRLARKDFKDSLNSFYKDYIGSDIKCVSDSENLLLQSKSRQVPGLDTEQRESGMKTDQVHKETSSNSIDMARKKKEKTPTPEQPVAKAEAKKDVKTEAKTEVRTEQEDGIRKTRKPREPQMITSTGAKVTHAHVFQSTFDQSTWYFTARLDGTQLKPMRMFHSDYEAFKNKEMGIPELMQKYYPTKLQPQLSPEAFQAAVKLPDGQIIEKFNVYKEKNQSADDFGSYKFYAQVGDKKMSTLASYADLNAYFDRTQSPAELVARNFGEKLQLKGAYDKYELAGGVDPKSIRIIKDRETKGWYVYADLGDRGKTESHRLPFEDGQALFKNKIASREQIAAKHLNNELVHLTGVSVSQKQEASLKR